MKSIKRYFCGLCLLALLGALSGCAQPKPLVYQDVAGFQVSSADFNTVNMVVDLRFFNPNNYSLALKNGDLDAFINNIPLGKATLDERTVVPAYGTFILPVTLHANIRSILQNALDVLTNKDVLIRIDGTVRAGKGGIFLSIPIHYTGTQKIKL